MTTDPSPTYNDEIDLVPILRASALTLWKTRWVILIVTLAAAIVTFVVSFWILPRQYQATANVFIDQQIVEFSKSISVTGLTNFPTLPDLKVVVKLSIAPELLDSVLKDPAVVAAIGNEEISISDMVTAVDVGTDQLSLQVTDSNPQRAALLANTWAEKVTAMVNATYGLDAIAQALDSRVLQSQQNYEQAQAALEEALPQSQVNALSAQLDSKRADLESMLGSIIRTRRVLDDLQFFEQGLSGLSGETHLAVGDELALTTLLQRSLTVASESFTGLIDSASFAGFTVSKALEAATQMRAGLQARLTRLQNDQSRLEQEIPPMQGDLEHATAQLTQLTLERDQSQGPYNDLLKIQQLTSVQVQSSKVARVSMEAVLSEKAVLRNTLMNTALAGMVGLMLAVFWALLHELVEKQRG